MPSVLEGFAKRWRDAPRDVLLIVVSILIAFALDAWWGSLGERRADAEQVTTLRSEFITASRTLTSVADALAGSAQATTTLLTLMGPQAPSQPPDTVLALLRRSFNVGVVVPGHTTLDGVLASGNPRVMTRDSLAGMLGRWSGLMADLAVDAEHLERNRDVDLQAALVEIGTPGFAGVAAGQLGLPPSAFSTDTDRIIRSVKVYAGLYYRALRLRVLLESLHAMLQAADAIVEQLNELADVVSNREHS
jgi:hypothetical protein